MNIHHAQQHRSLHKKHGHHRHRYAHSHQALAERHGDDVRSGETELVDSSQLSKTAGHLADVARDGEMTSIACKEAIDHREKLSQMYLSLYTEKINTEGKIDASSVWLVPDDYGEQNIAQILAANSGLPDELR